MSGPLVVDAGQAACDRLARSREGLRATLLQRRARSRPAPGSGTTAGWLGHLKSVPGIGVVVDALTAWWAPHPLRPVMAAALAVLQPVVQRHPLGLALGGLLLGGLLAWSRPWRWVAARPLVAGLGGQLLTKALAALPVAAWLAAFTAMAAQANGAPTPRQADVSSPPPSGPTEPP